VAEALDVAGRLAEGRSAVDTIGDYVWACHLLGYQNADLTLHAGQVRDWYSSEDGLDLRALDADRAALEAAAATAEAAQQMQEQQIGVLAGAWRGRAGDSSRDFLVRHGQASRALTASLHRAVGALADLCDDLWQAVDDKVAAAVEIDERHAAQRAQWQAATRTVISGVGDRSLASELVDQEVKPFVDNDIRSDWVSAMQNAMASVASAFGAATAALSGEPVASFGVPGDLGPSWTPRPGDAAQVDAAGTAPSGWTGQTPGWPGQVPLTVPASSPVPASWPVPASSPVPVPAPAFPAPTDAVPAMPAAAPPAMPSVPSLGDLGGGLPGGAGGLADLGTQIADAVAGLLDTSSDPVPDAPDVTSGDGTQPEDDPAGEDDTGQEGQEDVETVEDTVDPSADDDTACEGADPGAPQAVEVDAAPPPLPTQPPIPPVPIQEPPVTPEPVGAETPCEIAADELPQAGP